MALSQVTDDFIGYLKAAGDEFDLGQATEFLVVAATLLDLKAARLLPAAEVEDEEDLALLEARDLLFARLLQYRAYKLAAAHLAELDRRAGRRFGRDRRAGAAVRRAQPGAADRGGPAPVRRDRGRGAAAPAGAGGRGRPHPRPAGQRRASTWRR